MKLKNKKTGEIKELQDILSDMIDNHIVPTLIAVENEWQDYEESEEYYYYIDEDGVIQIEQVLCSTLDMRKSIGNYFKTKEEAEKACDKLKAIKRLKDKGFRFNGWTIDDGLRISICTNTDEDDIYDEDKRRIKPDLDLLFGGKE